MDFENFMTATCLTLTLEAIEMKKYIYSAIALMGICGTSCSNAASGADSDNSDKAESAVTETHHFNKNSLVLYFSATGTTKGVAEQIAKITGGTLQEIAADPAYTEADLDWTNDESRSSVTMHDETSRPPIKPVDAKVSDFEVVYLGFPVWWDLAPHEVYTYLSSGALDGKDVYTFATSGGSTIDNSNADLKKTFPKVNWKGGQLLNNPDKTTLTHWIEQTQTIGE